MKILHRDQRIVDIGQKVHHEHCEQKASSVVVDGWVSAQIWYVEIHPLVHPEAQQKVCDNLKDENNW
jgi:hypothetical protein